MSIRKSKKRYKKALAAEGFTDIRYSGKQKIFYVTSPDGKRLSITLEELSKES